MALTPSVIPGQRITSAWGNEIRDRSNQVFASHDDLVLQWDFAPEGAQAVTLDTFRLWVRRGGQWLPPLTLPLGLYHDEFLYDPVDHTLPVDPGGVGEHDWATTVTLPVYTNRILLVSFSARYQLTSATANITFGAVINATNTGADGPLAINGGQPEFANGQEVCVFGWPLTFQNAAYRASTSGIFKTAGTPGQTLSVRLQHAIVGTAGAAINVSNRDITVVDVGPVI